VVGAEGDELVPERLPGRGDGIVVGADGVEVEADEGLALGDDGGVFDCDLGHGSLPVGCP
jgi:hypothetical protein